MFVAGNKTPVPQFQTATSLQRQAAITRSSSSKTGRIPISKTAAYSWLQVQKIMEFSAQPNSESLEKHPATRLEQSTSVLTRNNSSLSSTSSVSMESCATDSTDENDGNDENDADDDDDHNPSSIGIGSKTDSLPSRNSTSNTIGHGENSHNKTWNPKGCILCNK